MNVKPLCAKLQKPTQGDFMKATGHATESVRVPRPKALKSLPEVVVYEGHDYGGHHIRTNLNMQVISRDLNDKISSIIVVQGKWRFYRDPNFLGDYWDLDVGYYPSIGSATDVISSFQCIEYPG
jgi:hypothetical protein